MRTTLTLDDDVLAAVEKLRADEGIGMSEALNKLVRRGLIAPQERRPYRHRTADLGARIEIDDIAGVLELLDESP